MSIAPPTRRASHTDADFSVLALHYKQVRARTEELCHPLELDDYQVQSMPDASPAKWHLAHTSWFFETFILAAHAADYEPVHPAYSALFNSYYHTVGERWPRPSRGILSRPTVPEVYVYRRAIDDRIGDLLLQNRLGISEPLLSNLILGLHHEQQHQELLLTDLKHLFAGNPLRPAYQKTAGSTSSAAAVLPLAWRAFPAGVRWQGHDGDGFAFDNEMPRHRVLVEAFEIASRLATVEEYLAFMDDGGYARPELWLSDGWNARTAHDWRAPLYWEQADGRWSLMTLHGMRSLTPAEPVCHISYYEADAFARWAGARLPTEAEWHAAVEGRSVQGNFVESGYLHPVAAAAESESQLFGDVWEWTASPYSAYPGYRPPAGALGEYNGKFMCNQMVLKGGSCATPRSHIRPGYRNFFPPEARWQFAGVRLSRDA